MANHVYNLVRSSNLILFGFLFTASLCFGQIPDPSSLSGLFFTGNHAPPASPYRTSPGYKLKMKTKLMPTDTRPVILSGNYAISFRVSFWSDFSHGNIFRVENPKYSIKFNFNHHPDSAEVFLTLALNGEATSVVFPIERSNLHDGKWYDLVFEVDEKRGRINGEINGLKKTFKTNPFFWAGESSINFGADGPTYDCAAMILQDLKLIIDGKLKHHWLFNEMEGNTAYDLVGDLDARVSDHDWLINRHLTPFYRDSFFIASPEPVVISINENRKELVIQLPGETKIYDLTLRTFKSVASQSGESDGNVADTKVWNSGSLEFEDSVNQLKYTLYQHPGRNGLRVRIFTVRLPVLTRAQYDDLLENSPVRIRARAEAIKFWSAIGAGMVAVFIAGYFGVRYFRKLKEFDPEPDDAKATDNVVKGFPKTNYISIFGSLEIIDRNGINHADNLPPMLRELMSIIVFYSRKHDSNNQMSGASLKLLEETLWYNIKSENLKNNRNVAFANIRKATKGFEGLTLQVKDNEVTLIHPDDTSNKVEEFFNLLEYLETAQPNPNENAFATFTGIVSEGMALAGLHSEWADNTRSILRSKVIGILEKYMTILQGRSDHEACIKVAGIAFMHDPLHEVTLKLILRSQVALGETAKAEMFYQNFCERYYEALKEEFPFEFDEFVEG